MRRVPGDGYVIGSSIKSVPLAGRDLNLFIQQLLRERGEKVPPEDSLDVSRRIKEQHCYVVGGTGTQLGSRPPSETETH